MPATIDLDPQVAFILITLGVASVLYWILQALIMVWKIYKFKKSGGTFEGFWNG